MPRSDEGSGEAAIGALTLRELGPGEAAESASSFLQGEFWGLFKSRFGWKPRRFLLRSAGQAEPLLVLERRLAPGFSFAYIPHGPSGDPGEGARAAALSALAKVLKPFLARDCAFIRFDPPWALRVDIGRGQDEGEESEGAPAATAESGMVPERIAIGAPLRKAADIQPPDTVVLALDRDDEALLAGMKPKWRYNIRLAAKKGVVVTQEPVADGEGAYRAGCLDEFYALYAATAQRDRIALHPKAYYEGLFALALERRASGGPGAAPDLRLWVARHDGEALAAIITAFQGRRATYLYGASSDAKRSLMPAYALQWEAMRAARDSGCAEYDFYGIPPGADPKHPMAGLYRFKTGFGGQILRYPGCWDAPLRPLAYAAYRAAETARLLWFKTLKKRLGR